MLIIWFSKQVSLFQSFAMDCVEVESGEGLKEWTNASPFAATSVAPTTVKLSRDCHCQSSCGGLAMGGSGHGRQRLAMIKCI